MTREDLTVVGSIGYTRRVWDKTVLMARAGVLDLEKIVTKRIPLAEIVPNGFEVLTQPSDELKIIVQVNE